MEGAPPLNWPALALAVVLALVAAYLVAGAAARLAGGLLRSIVADPETDVSYVKRPERIVKRAVFVVTAIALVLPAMKIAGYRSTVGGDPEALARWLLNAGLRIVIICVITYLLIRLASAAARRFEREMSRGSGLDVVERTKRAATLSRLLRKTLSILVAAIALLMVLRELDIDITPVLTGAGIAGLAIGFGAQTLVRDIISGFFLILEDQVRVGDIAVVNGTGGLVEEVNLRTIVLRDYEGTVHVFPNGEIKTLSNRTKDFSFYVIDVAMEYGDEPERVIAAMKDAAASMLDDPAFKPHILEPLEVAGVDAFAESQVTIRARIKTVPLKQWEVGRELRRRLYHLMRERGITIPFPQLTVHVEGHDVRATKATKNHEEVS